MTHRDGESRRSIDEGRISRLGKEYSKGRHIDHKLVVNLPLTESLAAVAKQCEVRFRVLQERRARRAALSAHFDAFAARTVDH